MVSQGPDCIWTFYTPDDFDDSATITAYETVQPGGHKYVRADLFESLRARAEAAEAERDRLRPWAELGRLCMEGWPEIGDIDGFDLHDLSVKCGVLIEVPGGYDPDLHFDCAGIAPERGDPWFEIIGFPRAALKDGGQP